MTMPISIPTWVGIFFAPVAAVDSNFIGLVEENSYCCCSRKETQEGTKNSCYVEKNLL